MDISWIGPATLVGLWIIGAVIVLAIVVAIVAVIIGSARNTLRADAIKKASAAGVAADRATRKSR